MSFRFLRLLLALVMAALGAPAVAQQAQPGLFESLGKLFQQDKPAPADSRSAGSQ